MARPTVYTEELGERICAQIAGGMSLRKACRKPGMPAKATVLGWLSGGKHPEFSDQYARAREAQADSYVDEVVDIADEAKDTQKAKLRIDARKWAAAKQAPKRYGDAMKLEHSGPGGAPLAPIRVDIVNEPRPNANGGR